MSGEIWTVKRIVGEKVVSKKNRMEKYYEVQWENTFEPARAIQKQVPDKVAEYKASKASGVEVMGVITSKNGPNGLPTLLAIKNLANGEIRSMKYEEVKAYYPEALFVFYEKSIGGFQ
ncbi:hypothetical protein AB6A40_006313 [Gnathostoma spinigerum]|uniref:Uncharacterized protein n=1 Tax=Gnathostoma spinigerum TaxID=75299 RepID=A0ABD6EI09_9BILA